MALVRTAAFAVLLTLFYAGHESQPFQLDIPRTVPTPRTSHSAPALMERSAHARR